MMDEERANGTVKILHSVDEQVKMNEKPSNIVMINQSTSDSYFNRITTDCGVIELKNNYNGNNTHKLKSIELIPNDREIPDFLEHNDDEDLYIPGDVKSIKMWSRGTQTHMKDIQSEPNNLETREFNYPAVILNDESKRKNSSSNQIFQELMIARSQLNSVYHNYQTMKMRFDKLHADYQKVLDIAAELTTSLENSARGQTVDIGTTLQACKRIHPELFNRNVRDDDRIKLSRKVSEIDYLDKKFKVSMLNTVPLPPKDLNYKKIKLHLINGNVRTKLLLLQALRWKITLNQPGERDEAIIEYIRSDLLGLHGQIAGDSGKLILPYILIPLDLVVPHHVQQSAARLLNTFASFKCGRDYLAVGPSVLNVIIECLDSTHAESIDAFTCDMIIATLQKLSLRKHQRLYMISAGMIEWLIHHLKAEYFSMGTYRLEYATALLMNLSLHKEAQTRGAAIANVLISTLIGLLSIEHLPALPYVYGALNNFLAHSAIDEQATMMGLKSILEHHRNYRTGELRKHLDHILLRYRRKFNYIAEEEMNDDDPLEENDILEDELDEMDPVKVQAGDLFGEGLLATCYSRSPYISSTDKNKFTNCSSPEISFKTDDEFSAQCKKDKLEKDHYLSFHSQRLSPRLSPVHCKSQFRNMVQPNIHIKSSINSKLNEKSEEKFFIGDRSSITSSETGYRINKILADTTSFIMLDHLHFTNTPSKNNKEKVLNSFNTCQRKETEFLPMKSRQIKTSETNSWTTSWNMITNEIENFKQSKVVHSKHCLLHEMKNISESTLYSYENMKSKENSMTAVKSGLIASSTITNNVCEGAQIAEEKLSSIASFDINLNLESNQTVTESTNGEEDAFAAKPRILRTPPQSMSRRGDCANIEFTLNQN